MGHCEQFFGVLSLRGGIVEKLSEGQWRRLMTLMRF